MPEIWIGEASPEVGCRRLTLRHRRETTVDVGSTPFRDLKANRIVWILGLRVRWRDGQYRVVILKTRNTLRFFGSGDRSRLPDDHRVLAKNRLTAKPRLVDAAANPCSSPSLTRYSSSAR